MTPTRSIDQTTAIASESTWYLAQSTTSILTPPDWWPDNYMYEVTSGVTLYDLLAALTLLVVSATVLYGIYRIVSRIRATPGDEFYSLIEEQDEVTVLMHPNPDPDAMASAMGVKALAEHVGALAHIQYTGQIRHQENRAFKNVLDVECSVIETASELETRDSIILVDHNTPRGFTEAETIEPIAVIDHHPGNGTGTEFTDVRTEYGATATIVTEYLTEITNGALENTAGGSGDDAFTISAALATGLAYGVYADTKHLTQGCIKPDFDACATLFPQIDSDILNRIANPQVAHDVLKVKATAINNIQIDGSFGVCNVGGINNVDALSQAVDETMRIEGVTAAVVYGTRDGTVHMSGRSHDDRVHIGECLQRTVSDMDITSAGGHSRMGGGQIPVAELNSLTSADNDPYNEFNERLFASLNGDN